MSVAQKTYYHKAKLQDRYIVELSIYAISDDDEYPDNIKYRLICTHAQKKSKVLFDNHSPKGHHFHIDDEEFPYEFVTEDKLLNDFKKLVFDHFGVRL